MLSFLVLCVSQNPAEIKTNKINNMCSFNTLRIDKKDVICKDFGINKKYCNHYSLPSEFIITNENGMNGEEIFIRPRFMIYADANTRTKMAKFYYSFTCHPEYGTSLELNIVPSKRFDTTLMEDICFGMLLLVLCIILFPCVLASAFVSALGPGHGDGNRIFCE